MVTAPVSIKEALFSEESDPTEFFSILSPGAQEKKERTVGVQPIGHANKCKINY